MALSPSAESEDWREVLIRLRREPPADAESAIRLIERAGGRVKHAFLPMALIVELPADRVAQIVGRAGIEAVETDLIDETLWLEADLDWRTAVSVWNQHRAAAERPPAGGRAWDAPGYLPPDPPAEIREKLRRREQELESGEE